MTERQHDRPAHRWSANLEAKIAAVRAAMTKLEDNHVAWILQAAMGHFAEGMKEMELEVLRHERFPDAPMYSRYGRALDEGTLATREKEVAAMLQKLKEYHAILDFLNALRDAESLRSAEVFARQIRDSGIVDLFVQRPARPRASR